MVIHRFQEYKFALNNIKNGNVLDVGCNESVFCLLLSCCGIQTYGLDINPYPLLNCGVGGKNFKFVQEDIRYTTFPSHIFDTVIAISTLEHVGLDAYKNKKYEEFGDIQAIHQIKRIMKDDGVLILTLPYGYGHECWWKTYNKTNLGCLIQGFKTLEKKFVKSPSWDFVTEQEAESTFHGTWNNHKYSNEERCTVLLKLVKA